MAFSNASDSIIIIVAGGLSIGFKVGGPPLKDLVA